jgi:predicted lipoprotein
LVLFALSACTVVTIADDRQARERQSEGFDAARYVNEIWPTKVAPAFAKAPSLGDVLAEASTGLDAAGRQYGRQAGEGSPWTFTAQADGTVTAVDRASRAGSVTLRVDTKTGAKDIQLQTGPVVSGSAVRDSQAYITFNDFTNQIAYANVSREMNRKAMANTAGALAALKPGDRVHVAGAFAIARADQPVRMTPVSVEPGK